MALATLSIDLEARLAKLDQDLNQANRIAAKHTAQMAASFEKVKVAGAAIGAALVGGFSVSAVLQFIERTSEAAAQIERLAQVAGSSAAEFQAYAAGAKSAGMDMDKFAGVMKDVQDKIGDFLSTGGGELKDFFEKVAPKVGVTAEQFRNLSGPQALQLFYSTMEKANVGSKEMVFFLEAIADDASALAPLLRDGGAGFAKLASEAQKAGAIMSNDLVKSGVELNKTLKEFKANTEGVSNAIAGDLFPVLNRLMRELIAGREAFGGFGSAVMNLGTARPFDNAVTGLQYYQGKLREVQADLAKIESGEERSTGLYGSDRLGPLRKQAAELQRFVAYYQKVLGLRDEAGAGRGLTNPTETSGPAPWKPDPEKKPPTEAERYLQQLQSEADKLADLTQLNQALKDVQAGRLEGLTPALKGQILDQAAANDETRMQLFLQQQLAAQAERDSKLFVGPELPPDIEARITRLNELLRETPTAKLEEARKDMLLLASSFEEGRISAEQFTEAAQSRLGTLPDDLKKVEGLFDDLKQSIEGWGRDSAAAIVDFGITGKASFGDMVNSMVADIARLATYRLITQPLFNAIGSMLPSFGGAPAGPVSGPGIKFANGGAFDAGVQAFADGGVFTNSIVSTPTLFKFGQGTGLMGEAGPEAIMPLRRDASGRLGVSAAGAGGGGGHVSVEIHNYGGNAVKQRTVPDGRGGRRIEVVIGELAAGEIRRPGSALNNSARAGFGLAPALVGR